MSCEYDYTIKTLLVGDSGVGKSSIMIQFVDQEYQDKYSTTVGVDYKTIPIRIEPYFCKLLLWDTAGQERFRTLSKIYYRGAQAVIYVYDITDRESFDNLKYWMKEVEEVAPDNIVKILVGNKSELLTKRMVSINEAQEFALTYRFTDFFEVSAKNSLNIDKPFLSIVSTIITISAKYQNDIKSKTFNLDSKTNSNINKSYNWKKYFCFFS